MRFIPAVSPVQIQVPLPWLHVSHISLGALVKRLRHRPFTAVTRVRFPSGSPTPLRGMTGHTRYGGIAQLVERPPHTRKVTDSSSVVSTTKTPETERFQVFLFSRKKGNGDLFGGRPPPTGQATDLNFVVSAAKQSRQTAWLFLFFRKKGNTDLFGGQTSVKST